MQTQPMQVDVLIRGGFVVTMDDAHTVYKGGDVAVLGDRIVYAGPAKPDGAWASRRVINANGRAVLPGIVNSHTHTASAVFRSLTDDGVGGLGLYSVAFRMEEHITDEEWADLAVLGCCEMIRAGCTTINDIWYAPDRLAEAVEQTGLRAVIANKVFDVNLAELVHDDYTRYPKQGEAKLKAGVEFVEQWHGKAGGRIIGRIGTHASDTVSPGLAKEALQESRRLGVGLHMHVAQHMREVAYINRTQGGKGPVEYLTELGFLSPDVTCAHLTYASDRDIQCMVETGARYVCAPTIYPRRGKFPRLLQMLEAGVSTGFATDWVRNDPFEGMRNAIFVSRVLAGNGDVLPAERALELYTRASARALNLDHEVGSLEVGKKADLLLINLQKPHLQPFWESYPSLVYNVNTADIETVLVDGTVVLEDGRVTGVDEAAAIRRVQRHMDRWHEVFHSLGGERGGAFSCPCGC